MGREDSMCQGLEVGRAGGTGRGQITQRVKGRARSLAFTRGATGSHGRILGGQCHGQI